MAPGIIRSLTTTSGRVVRIDRIACDPFDAWATSWPDRSSRYVASCRSWTLSSTTTTFITFSLSEPRLGVVPPATLSLRWRGWADDGIGIRGIEFAVFAGHRSRGVEFAPRPTRVLGSGDHPEHACPQRAEIAEFLGLAEVLVSTEMQNRAAFLFAV